MNENLYGRHKKGRKLMTKIKRWEAIKLGIRKNITRNLNRENEKKNAPQFQRIRLFSGHARVN